jgi:hypothetical protein
MRDKALETTYSSARQNFARLMDKVANDREVVFINRQSQKGRVQRVALVGKLLSSVRSARSEGLCRLAFL